MAAALMAATIHGPGSRAGSPCGQHSEHHREREPATSAVLVNGRLRNGRQHPRQRLEAALVALIDSFDELRPQVAACVEASAPALRSETLRASSPTQPANPGNPVSLSRAGQGDLGQVWQPPFRSGPTVASTKALDPSSPGVSART
ncbi:MAG TPA: hypothetical protein VH912_28760 [Streptosporangiaceae bacterium]